MGLWITSITQARQHGVFAIDVPPPALIQAVSTGRVGLVGQFPWGPEELTEKSQGEAKALFAPFGMNRLASGYLSLLGRAFADLVIVRVLGTDAAKARAILKTGGGTSILEVEPPYKGAEGNRLVAEVANASDGDSNKFKLTVTITGVAGAQVETIDNIDVSGSNTSFPGVADLQRQGFLFIGKLTKLAGGRPANGVYLFSQSELVSAATPATTTGTTDMTTAGLYGGGGTLNGKGFTINGNPVSFSSPADGAAVVTAINTAAGATIVAIDDDDHLVFTSTTTGDAATLVLAAGTPDALAVLGVTAGPYTGSDAVYEGRGSDGVINAAAYVGTEGAPDRGISLLEADKAVRHVFVDDCGSGLRAAVNAGLRAHATRMGDRVAYINGPSGAAAVSAVRSDASNYSSANVVYCDPWVWIYDDTTGAEQLVPSAGFAASVASQLPPSTSIAWKNALVQAMLQGIVRLEYQRGTAAGGNTAAGVATFIREESGGHTIEAGVVTIAPADPAKKNLTRTQMGIYIAASLRRSLRGFTDAPNLRAIWDQILVPVKAFLEGLKNASKSDAVALLVHIKDYELGPIEAANTAAEIAAGDLKVPLKVATSSGIERLVFLFQYGETVTVTLVQ